MAVTDKQKIIQLCNQINKKEGEGTIYSIGSKHANLKINRWSTGIEDLDAIIGGGIPEGRTVEIFGPESSGKTTLLYHLMSMHSLALELRYLGTDRNNFWFIERDTERMHSIKAYSLLKPVYLLSVLTAFQVWFLKKMQKRYLNQAIKIASKNKELEEQLDCSISIYQLSKKLSRLQVRQ